MSRSVVEEGTWAPLETEADPEDGHSMRSDHRVAFCRLELERGEAFTWKEYSYRQYTPEAIKNFKDWIVMHDE